jgi:hypothetical protein
MVNFTVTPHVKLHLQPMPSSAAKQVCEFKPPSVRAELVEAFAKSEISKMRRVDRELRRCGKFRCKILRKHARI